MEEATFLCLKLLLTGRIILHIMRQVIPLSEHLRQQWHPSKNEGIDINQIAASSKQKAWWIGECEHEWQATIGDRSRGQNCPFCSGNKILVGFNDLAFKNPMLAAQWHPVKNGDLKPHQVTPNANSKAWWLRQECGHEWEAKISSRNRRNDGCPVCYGRLVLRGFNDLATTHPQIISEWHPTKNGTLTPYEIGRGSQRKVWWICQKGHEWETSPNNRTGKGITSCPICAGRIVLAGFNDLATTHPEMATQWHPTKNLPLTPFDINHGARTLVWWICSNSHEWQSPVYGKRKNKIGCAICAGQKVLAGFNDLLTVSPTLAAQWHPTRNNTLSPTMVTSNSTQKVWWNCTLGHVWQAKVNSRYASSNGCPICSGHTVLAGFNDFGTLGGTLLTQWHPTKNLPLTPKTITMGSNQKVWWICKKGHEWEVRIPDRRRGESCPTCRNSEFISKAEQDIANFLIQHGLDIIQTNRKLIGKELDIYIPAKKIAIEYNGVFWHTEKAGKGKSYHYDKWLAAKNVGIQLIQIWEDEWNRNPEQVKAMLLHKLGISNDEKVFARNTMTTLITETDAEPFLNSYHIEGFPAGDYYLGLRDKKKNELVAVMVIKKRSNNTLEIMRYATSKHVVGAFSKLLKYAELSFVPKMFVATADNCVSDGSLYATNEFTVDREIAPDYRYVVRAERKDKSEYTSARFKDDPNLQWQDGLTDKELAELNNIYRIWDAGKTLWVKTVG